MNNTARAFDPDQFMIDSETSDLRQFMPQSELACLRESCHGEEKQFFIVRMVELAALIYSMPKTYEQDGKGDQAIAYLHYFKGGGDWYITEKDADQDGEGQIQAFGLADLGYGPELGYISIQELIENNVELDLHFTPCTLAKIKVAA